MSGPSNSDKETLGKRLKSRQLCAEILGWLVGLGLLVEFWDEIVDCVVNWHRPSRALTGGLLVTVGVFGEVLFSRLALITSDELQGRADSDVAQANERAATAVAEAARLSKETEELRRDNLKMQRLMQPRRIVMMDRDCDKEVRQARSRRSKDSLLQPHSSNQYPILKHGYWRLTSGRHSSTLVGMHQSWRNLNRIYFLVFSQAVYGGNS
jgi:hypothetical protein